MACPRGLWRHRTIGMGNCLVARIISIKPNVLVKFNRTTLELQWIYNRSAELKGTWPTAVTKRVYPRGVAKTREPWEVSETCQWGHWIWKNIIEPSPAIPRVRSVKGPSLRGLARRLSRITSCEEGMASRNRSGERNRAGLLVENGGGQREDTLVIALGLVGTRWGVNRYRVPL